jgi:hypothetical protein
MTDITKLTDQEKSVMLARAMGLFTNYDISNWSEWEREQLQHEAHSKDGLNLYKVINFPLAWRVLNWAWNLDPSDKLLASMGLYSWHEEIAWIVDFDKPPAEAQRLWLDCILKLAVESGVIEIADKEE